MKSAIAKKLTSLLNYHSQWESVGGGLRHRLTKITIKPIWFGMEISTNAYVFHARGWAAYRLKRAYSAWIHMRSNELDKISVESIGEVVNDPSNYDPQTIVKLRNAGDW